MAAKKKNTRFSKGTLDHDGDGKMGGSKKAAAATVAVDGAIYDGKGGYLKKGDELPETADLESLKAKGLA